MSSSDKIGFVFAITASSETTAAERSVPVILGVLVFPEATQSENSDNKMT